MAKLKLDLHEIFNKKKDIDVALKFAPRAIMSIKKHKLMLCP